MEYGTTQRADLHGERVRELAHILVAPEVAHAARVLDAEFADGDADKLSPSHLYFTNKAGDKVWRLPYDMTGDFASPELVN